MRETPFGCRTRRARLGHAPGSQPFGCPGGDGGPPSLTSSATTRSLYVPCCTPRPPPLIRRPPPNRTRRGGWSSDRSRPWTGWPRWGCGSPRPPRTGRLLGWRARRTRATVAIRPWPMAGRRGRCGCASRFRRASWTRFPPWTGPRTTSTATCGSAQGTDCPPGRTGQRDRAPGRDRGDLLRGAGAAARRGRVRPHDDPAPARGGGPDLRGPLRHAGLEPVGRGGRGQPRPRPVKFGWSEAQARGPSRSTRSVVGVHRRRRLCRVPGTTVLPTFARG